MRSIRLLFAALLLCISQIACTTIADAKAGKGTGLTKTYPVSSEKIWLVMPAAVKSAGIDYISENKKEGYALAQLGISAFSWGENIAIFIEPIDVNNTKVELVIKQMIDVKTEKFSPQWSRTIFEKINELTK